MIIDQYSIDFIKRTFNHIRLVQDCAVYLIKLKRYEIPLTYSEVRQLLKNISIHDNTKWTDPQFETYIGVFNRKTIHSNSVIAEEAFNDHYERENHHPQEGSELNKLQIIEMCCDLSAMSIEFYENSALPYYNKNIKHLIKCPHNQELAERTLKFLELYIRFRDQ